MRLFTLAAMAAWCACVSFAGAQNCADAGATYVETAMFNQVVGDARFVGAFKTGPDRCDVTLFQAAANDELLQGPMRRMELPIAAGARSVLGVGPDTALAIACNADAKAIQVESESAPSVGEN